MKTTKLKKQLIIGSFMALTGVANAQWDNPTGVNVTPGSIGIGTPTAPVHKLDVRTSVTDDGIQVTQSGTGAAGLYLNNILAGGHKYSFASTSNGNTLGGGFFSIYDHTALQTRFNISPTGNIGVGTGFTTPVFKLEMIGSTTGDDGIKFTQSSTGQCGLYLNNLTGLHWLVNSTPNGFFNVEDKTSGTVRFQIQPNGNVRLGNGGGSSNVKFMSQTYYVPGIASAIQGDAWSADSPIGVSGNAECNNNTGGRMALGVAGYAFGAQTNYGGHFSTYGNSPCVTGVHSYAVYGKITNPCPGDYAGLFDGSVNVNGDIYLYNAFYASDKKLKKDIMPITNSLDKIKLLKPSTYNFRTDEFKGMNLPKEQQLGVIAQELEQVFPELVTEIEGHDQTDKNGKITGSTVGHKAVNYIGLIPVLIAGIQEQQKTIDQQTRINADLQQQLNEQKELISSMKASGATGINATGAVEAGFRMSQNEPNPFTHETLVRYNLPQSVNTAFMAVYDLTGKQIATFPIQQKGAASLTITSEKLSAGIYIYSIVADGKVVDSKRMIVADK